MNWGWRSEAPSRERGPRASGGTDGYAGRDIDFGLVEQNPPNAMPSYSWSLTAEHLCLM